MTQKIRTQFVTIREKQEELVREFSAVATWEDRYKKIIELGRSQKPLAAEFKVDDLKVKGCQSSVWLRAYLNGKNVYFEAESDASIVNGLVALLVRVYSGHTPQEILATPADFLSDLGLNTNLSQTRVSGLASMVKQIKFYAVAFQAVTG